MNNAEPVLAFTVIGTPIPQGSLTARPIYAGVGRSKRFTGKIEMVDASKKLRPWRENVTWHALDAAARQKIDKPMLGPMRLDVSFMLPRPQSHYRTGRNSDLLAVGSPVFPTLKKDDLDKLVRAVMDGITDARVWRDDGQVVAITARKVYAELGEHPGCRVVIDRVTNQRFGVKRHTDHLAAETLPIAGELL